MTMVARFGVISRWWDDGFATCYKLERLWVQTSQSASGDSELCRSLNFWIIFCNIADSSLLCSSTQPISASAPALLQRTSKDVHLCQVLALFFLTLTCNLYSSSSPRQTCLTTNTQLIVRDRAPMDTSNNRNTEAMEEDYNIHAVIGDLPQAPTRSYGNGFRA